EVDVSSSNKHLAWRPSEQPLIGLHEGLRRLLPCEAGACSPSRRDVCGVHLRASKISHSANDVLHRRLRHHVPESVAPYEPTALAHISNEEWYARHRRHRDVVGERQSRIACFTTIHVVDDVNGAIPRS